MKQFKIKSNKTKHLLITKADENIKQILERKNINKTG